MLSSPHFTVLLALILHVSRSFSVNIEAPVAITTLQIYTPEIEDNTIIAAPLFRRDEKSTIDSYFATYLPQYPGPVLAAGENANAFLDDVVGTIAECPTVVTDLVGNLNDISTTVATASDPQLSAAITTLQDLISTFASAEASEFTAETTEGTIVNFLLNDMRSLTSEDLGAMISLIATLDSSVQEVQESCSPTTSLTSTSTSTTSSSPTSSSVLLIDFIDQLVDSTTASLSSDVASVVETLPNLLSAFINFTAENGSLAHDLLVLLFDTIIPVANSGDPIVQYAAATLSAIFTAVSNDNEAALSTLIPNFADSLTDATSSDLGTIRDLISQLLFSIQNFGESSSNSSSTSTTSAMTSGTTGTSDTSATTSDTTGTSATSATTSDTTGISATSATTSGTTGTSDTSATTSDTTGTSTTSATSDTTGTSTTSTTTSDTTGTSATSATTSNTTGTSVSSTTTSATTGTSDSSSASTGESGSSSATSGDSGSTGSQSSQSSGSAASTSQPSQTSGQSSGVSSSPTATNTPYIEANDSNGSPSFHIFVPFSLGPWSSVSFVQDSISTNFEWSGNGSFDLDGTPASASDYTDDVSSSFFDATYGTYPSGVTLLKYTSPEAITFTNGGTYTLQVDVSIDTESAEFVKRSENFVLSVTITIPPLNVTGSSSSSEENLGSSATLSGSSETTSKGESFSTTSSTAVSNTSNETFRTVTTTSEGESGGVTTTVVTITSCSDHKCTKFPVTTGLTEYTETINGRTTIFTTYCPLTSQKAEPSVTTITTTEENGKTVVYTSTLSTKSEGEASSGSPEFVTKSSVVTAITTTEENGETVMYTTTVSPKAEGGVSSSESPKVITGTVATLASSSSSPRTSTGAAISTFAAAANHLMAPGSLLTGFVLLICL